MSEIRTLETIRTEAETKVEAHNSLIAESKYDEALKLRAPIAEVISEYAAASCEACFAELKAAGDNAMIEAVKRLTFPTLKLKEERKEGVILAEYSIEDAEKPIDLRKLHKYCGGIGKDQNWIYLAEKLNFLLTAQKASDLGIADLAIISDSYAMSSIARDLDMGKTPTSKTNILKTLQSIVTAMVGEEFKATSHDVNFLMSVYSKKSNKKALTVTCANHRWMAQYLMEICHRIVLSKGYEIDYKKTSNK